MGASRSKMATTLASDGGVQPIRAASTIVLAPFKEEGLGYRVCMVKRASTMKFMPNTYVFPGGKVDQKDFDVGQDPEEVPGCYSHRPERVAAVRELYEEVGIVMNRMGTTSSINYARFTPSGAHLLVPFERWVTPRQEKKRFDTFFFLLLTRPEQADYHKLVPQEGEISDAMWITPKDALLRHADQNDDFNMPPPTYLMMHKLSTYPTAPPVVHEHQLSFAQMMHRMPIKKPEIRINQDDGAFEMHFPPAMFHFWDGVHEFPGNYTRNDLLPPGITKPPECWRVYSDSPLYNPKNNELFDTTLPDYLQSNWTRPDDLPKPEADSQQTPPSEEAAEAASAPTGKSKL